MPISISCKELEFDCPFVARGETKEVVIDSLMCHVQTEHCDEWFEIEEIYRVACSLLLEKTF